MTAIHNIGIRVGMEGDVDTKRRMDDLGEAGHRALKKIHDATEPAGLGLRALDAVSEEAGLAFEGFAEHSGRLGGVLTRLGPAGLAAAAAIGVVVLAIDKGLEEFKQTEKAINALNAALKATDSSSGVTTERILKLGEAVEKNTLFKKTDILQAAAALTSFQNVAGTTFTRALRLSTDLATRLGTDVPSAADMLGRALDAPAEGLGRLDRKFTDLSPAQKEVIANFIKQGDIASAQAVILSHLEEKTRGLAESQATGLTGSTNALNDAWNNLMESFGRTVGESDIAKASLASLTSAVISLRKAIDPTQSERKTQLEKEIADMENSFGTRLDRAVLGSAPELDARKTELKKINDALAAEQAKSDADEARATEAAKTQATQRLNGQLLELQKKYQKESEDLTLTSQQKILKEAAERRKEILGISRNDPGSDAAQKALAALDASTRARIADANKKDGESEASKKRRAAIDEINRAALQTKPSFDIAKAALDDWKAKLVEDLGGASEENEKYLALIEQIYKVKLKNIYDKALIDSDKWADGAARGLKRYADEATNAAKNSEKVFGDAAQKIEDSLVDMVSTGEFSMKKLGDLVQSIEQDILRSFLRENVTGPIAGQLSSLLGGGTGGSSGGGGIFGSLFSSAGSWLSSLFHEGGVVGETNASRRPVSPLLFAGAPRFHGGLMPDEFPAILQRGETVIPRNKRMNSGPNITFNISTPNAQSFMDSQGQIMSKMAGSLQRYKARNG